MSVNPSAQGAYYSTFPPASEQKPPAQKRLVHVHNYGRPSASVGHVTPQLKEQDIYHTNVVESAARRGKDPVLALKQAVTKKAAAKSGGAVVEKVGKIWAHWKCETCETDQTPERRYGPNGKHTLCNACGLQWKKEQTALNPPERKAVKVAKQRLPAPAVKPAAKQHNFIVMNPSPSPVAKPEAPILGPVTREKRRRSVDAGQSDPLGGVPAEILTPKEKEATKLEKETKRKELEYFEGRAKQLRAELEKSDNLFKVPLPPQRKAKASPVTPAAVAKPAAPVAKPAAETNRMAIGFLVN